MKKDKELPVHIPDVNNGRHIGEIVDIATDIRKKAAEDPKAAEIYVKTVERLAFDNYLHQIDEDEWTP